MHTSLFIQASQAFTFFGAWFNAINIKLTLANQLQSESSLIGSEQQTEAAVLTTNLQYICSQTLDEFRLLILRKWIGIRFWPFRYILNFVRSIGINDSFVGTNHESTIVGS